MIAIDGDDGGYGSKYSRAVCVASTSAPANTVARWLGRLPLLRASAVPGRALPAAQPHTEFTTIIVVPDCFTAASTASGVLRSSNPRRFSSARIGAMNGSG